MALSRARPGVSRLLTPLLILQSTSFSIYRPGILRPAWPVSVPIRGCPLCCRPLRFYINHPQTLPFYINHPQTLPFYCPFTCIGPPPLPSLCTPPVAGSWPQWSCGSLHTRRVPTRAERASSGWRMPQQRARRRRCTGGGSARMMLVCLWAPCCCCCCCCSPCSPCCRSPPSLWLFCAISLPKKSLLAVEGFAPPLRPLHHLPPPPPPQGTAHRALQKTVLAVEEHRHTLQAEMADLAR